MRPGTTSGRSPGKFYFGGVSAPAARSKRRIVASKPEIPVTCKPPGGEPKVGMRFYIKGQDDILFRIVSVLKDRHGVIYSIYFREIIEENKETGQIRSGRINTLHEKDFYPLVARYLEEIDHGKTGKNVEDVDSTAPPRV